MNDETIPAKPLPKMTPGAEHYWQSATRGQLVLPHCRVCDKVFFYPRIWCPHCFSHELDWRDASGRGDHNFTMFVQLCAIAADLIGAHAEERVRTGLAAGTGSGRHAGRVRPHRAGCGIRCGGGQGPRAP